MVFEEGGSRELWEGKSAEVSVKKGEGAGKKKDVKGLEDVKKNGQLVAKSIRRSLGVLM